MVDLTSLLPMDKLNPQEIWRGLQRWPAGLGNRAADFFAKVYVPHAGRMGFHLEELDERHIEASMPDRRGNRNHLGSLHAMALAHLGEFTCGALLLYAVAPNGYRIILRKYEIEYLAKARGRVTGRATLKLPRGKLDKKDVVVRAEITDREEKVVARVNATFRVGRVKG